MKKIDRKWNLNQAVKIRERVGQVTVTIKAITFHQVWHSYKYVKAITDEVINIKVIDISPMNISRPKSCNEATYNVRHDFYTTQYMYATKVHSKSHNYFYIYSNDMILNPNDS